MVVALAMAAIDGIKNSIDPGQPLDKNIYELSGKEKKRVPNTPGSLYESLNALAKDHAFLMEGGVFSEELIQTWIDYKTINEIDEIAFRPHPHEFHLYYDS